MKIVFLDIDGVLNSTAWYRNVRISGCGCLELDAHLDPEAVLRVRRILDASGARVVLSSSLRLIYHLSDLRLALTSRGLPEGAIIGITPNLCGRSRDDEIRSYLKQHSDEVDGFVILDDSANLDGLRSSQVKVDPATGLQDADVDDALHILCGFTEDESGRVE